jgi:hypothetical protein
LPFPATTSRKRVRELVHKTGVGETELRYAGSSKVRARGYFLEGLLDLARLNDRAERRSSWRQSIVSLGQATSNRGPAPLEGIDPAALVPAVKVALADGLIDDLDWLSAEAAAVALYEIASALPQGAEKREIGRRVAAHTYDGGAELFASVATRMALGTGKGLSGPQMRARVALVLELPFGQSARVDGLAYALASRRDLVKEWIARPSRGSLPARRLSGRLLERAAGEAARLASQGDEHAAKVFRGEALAKAYEELLWDRDPLVWKHAAVARGLLAGAVPAFAREIDEHLSARLSPTQWRRAATSLGAWVGVDPTFVVKRVDELLASPVLAKDHGVAGCLVWGLAHGAELEPEAAELLLSKLVVREGSSLAEAFEEGVREEPAWRETRPCTLLRRELRLLLAFSGGRADDGSASLAIEILRDLEVAARPERPVRRAVNEALAAFGMHGARRAHELAQEALVLAREQVATLEAGLDDTSPEGRRETYAVLRDLDISLLESAILPNLLALDRRTAEQGLSIPAVEELHDRVCRLFIEWESAPLPRGERPAHATVRLRRLKALIHLLDVDADPSSDSGFRVASVRGRWLRASHTVVRRLVLDPPSVFRRSLAAALARAIEGLVRAEVCDAVDALLFIAHQLSDPDHFKILAEASKHPDLIALLTRYETFLRAQTATAEPTGDDVPLSLPGFGATEEKDALADRFESLGAFAGELTGENSSREEALRAVLVRLSRALGRIHESASLAELATPAAGQDAPLASLEEATTALGQLVTAARLRLAEGEQDDVRSLPGRQQLGALGNAVERSRAGDSVDLRQAIVEVGIALTQLLPAPIALLATSALERVPTLPRTARKVGPVAPAESPLPSWLPPRRTLGGFYVLRPLGAGGVGSVFVVRRIEERNDPHAESFALKVPDYNAQVARHMSEADFLHMFQSEASALLSIPAHKNLARFVTFDLGARPKPILVMELVDGVTLETLLARRQLTTARALALLDGVLAGLEAMHGVGVAHLDLKPTNVVMRKGEEPVLVDFGLAGRHIRLGCGSGPYGAPEVWGLELEGAPKSPTGADVYALSCLAYETLTTQPLFDQPNEVALTTAHLSHDGWPTPLRSWHRQKELAPIAELLGHALRRNPKDRIDASTLRRKLAALAPPLSRMAWPLSP